LIGRLGRSSFPSGSDQAGFAAVSPYGAALQQPSGLPVSGRAARTAAARRQMSDFFTVSRRDFGTLRSNRLNMP